MLQPEKTVLPNGIRVVTINMAESASASLRFMLKAGSAFEREEEQGISHFAEHMLFQGTERRSSFTAIGRAIESIGGVINGQTGHLTTTYLVKMLPDHVETAFDVLSDMLLHPRLDPNDINRERLVVLEEIHRRHDRPDEYVWSMLEKVIWPDQPMGRATLGTPETLSTFDRNKLEAFFQDHYRSSDLVVAAAGPMEHQRLVELASQFLGGMASSNTRPVPQATFRPGRDVCVENRPMAQVNLCMGFPSFGRLDPRIHALHILITLLGRGISSRLFTSIRERLGLAYSIGAGVTDRVLSGAVVIRCGLRPDRLSEAVNAIIWELERLKNQPIEPEELSRAKELEKSQMLFGLERAEVVADHFGGEELLLGRMEPLENEVEQIEKTNVDDLRALSESLFNINELKAAAIGDVSGDVLERFLDQSLGQVAT